MTMVAEIIDETVRVFGVPRIDLKSHRTARATSRARMAGFYVSTRVTRCSLPMIGRIWGGFDHTSVIYATRRVPELCAQDPAYATQVEQLLAHCTTPDDTEPERERP